MTAPVLGPIRREPGIAGQYALAVQVTYPGEPAEIAYGTVIAARVTDEPCYGRTADGYGAKIPTRYMVKLPGGSRWRRVYAMCYGNSASVYVIVRGTDVFLDDHEIAAALTPNAAVAGEHATLSDEED